MTTMLVILNLVTVLFILYLAAQHVGRREFWRGIIYAWLLYAHALYFITSKNIPGIILTGIFYYLAIADLKQEDGA